MNKMLIALLVLLVIATIGVGLVSCGTADREPEEPPKIETPEPEQPDPPKEEEPEEEPKDSDSEVKDSDSDIKDTDVPPSIPTVNPPTRPVTPTPPPYVPNVPNVPAPPTTPTTPTPVVTDKEYRDKGTYSASEVIDDGTISGTGVILKNKTIKGDLTITKGVGNGEVHLENVIIEGTLYINGGGENSVYLKDVLVSKVVVDRGRSGKVRVEASGSTTIPLLQAYSGVTLKEKSLTSKGEGFVKVTSEAGNKLTNVPIVLYDCRLDEVYAREEMLLTIKSGCRIDLVNGRLETVTVRGDYGAIRKTSGDVDDDDDDGGSSGGGGGSSWVTLATPTGLSSRIQAPSTGIGGYDAQVSWNAVPNATGYTVTVGTQSKNVPAGTTYTDIGDLLPNGYKSTPTLVQVRANAGNGYYASANATINIGDALLKLDPSTPTLTYGTDYSLDVNWTAPTVGIAANYEVLLMNGTTQVAKYTPTSNTCNIPASALTNGMVYTVQVRAIANSGSINSGFVTSAALTYAKKLDKPTNLQIAIVPNSTTDYTLTWTSVPNATAYSLSINGGSPITYTTNSASLQNLAPNTSYAFSLVATGTGYAPSEALTQTLTTTTITPIAPFTLTLGGTPTEPTLTWTSETGVTYKIGSTTITSPHKLSGLSNDTNNSITVEATAAGKSSISSNITITQTQLPAPTITVAPTNATKATVSWTSANAKTYTLSGDLGTGSSNATSKDFAAAGTYNGTVKADGYVDGTNKVIYADSPVSTMTAFTVHKPSVTSFAVVAGTAGTYSITLTGDTTMNSAYDYTIKTVMKTAPLTSTTKVLTTLVNIPSAELFPADNSYDITLTITPKASSSTTDIYLPATVPAPTTITIPIIPAP